jgi:hypothetical protein
MKFGKLTPVIFVAEIEPCVPFWTEKLGWKVSAEVKHEDRLGFVLLESDGIELMYQSRASAAADMGLLEPRDVDTSVLLYVDVDDLDAVERALSDVPVLVPRRTTFYGTTEIGYREPGGNGLVGYAAIKYAAFLIIVLAILAFLAWYLIPAITGNG